MVPVFFFFFWGGGSFRRMIVYVGGYIRGAPIFRKSPFKS